MAKNTGTLDLSTLTPTDAELPKSDRGRPSKDNPFVAWLTESYESMGDGDRYGSGKAVTVPAGNVGEVEYLIRRAADAIGCGSRVVVQNSKGEILDKDARKGAKGNLTVLFAAKERRQKRDDAPVTESA